MIAIETIQRAIANCMAQEPPRDYVLSRDASLLSEILGEMIARGLTSIDESVVQDDHLEALNRWMDSR